MKTTAKVLTRIVAALAILVLALMAICLDGVDYRPYFRTQYYQQTKQHFERVAQTNAPVYGALRAGFGKARLTPKLSSAGANPKLGEFQSLPLAGYGNRRGRPATGTHDDLWTKAVAIEVNRQTVVLVGSDLLIVPKEISDAVARRIEAALGLQRDRIYFSATHTHCSLGGWGRGVVAEGFAGGFDPGVAVWVSECMSQAISQAVADLKPASFGHGRFLAPEFVRNRVVGDLGTVDPEFSFAVFRQETGATAVIGAFSAHATVLSGNMMEFSGDYPGYWQRSVEEATGGMAVFFAGCVGSHSPVPGQGGIAGAERMGRALGSKLVGLVPGVMLTNQTALSAVGIEVKLPPLNVRVGDGVRLRPWVSRRLLPVSDSTFLQALRISDTLWLSTPCDFSGELALDIKNSFRLRSFDTFITSFNGDYIGYVIPSRYYHMDGYEPRTMSFYGPNVPDYLCEFMRALGSVVIAN